MHKRVAMALVVMLVFASLSFAADPAAPFALAWKARVDARATVFEMQVTDAASGRVVLSPQINTRTSFRITSESESVPAATFVVSGKPLSGRTWELTLRVTRGSAVLQETSYTADVP